jgi:hypothetical protein
MLDSITVDDIGNVIGYGLPICPLRFLSCAGAVPKFIARNFVRRVAGHSLASATAAHKY